MPSIITSTLDNYFENTPIGSIQRAIGNNLYGIDHRKVKNAVPLNKDLYGYTFFVRPQLNLQAANIRNERRLYSLLSEESMSIQRHIRTLLDPRLFQSDLKCSLTDNEQAFIPMLSNNLISISGWPDITAPTYTSKAGLYNEGYSQVDGIAKYYETFDIDTTFQNTKGDPVTYLFYVWLYYSTLVFEGKLTPYIDFITENELDYTTRIYRIVTDRRRKVVTKIIATGACFPITVPVGIFGDYNKSKPYIEQQDISIRFRCMGAEVFDDILLKEFNKTVEIFNTGMIDDEDRESNMMVIPPEYLSYLNHKGYPYINTESNELEWWIRISEFEKVKKKNFIPKILQEKV